MRGIVLSGLCFAALVLLSGVGLHLRRWSREYRFLLALLAAAIAAYAVLFYRLPPNLGLLPDGLLEPAAGVDFVNGLVLLLLLFHGFWDYFYAVSNSPSGRFLMGIDRRGESGMTFDEIKDTHTGGDPADPGLERRLAKLSENGHIVEEPGGYRGRPSARKYALLVRTLQRIFNSGPGG